MSVRSVLLFSAVFIAAVMLFPHAGGTAKAAAEMIVSVRFVEPLSIESAVAVSRAAGEPIELRHSYTAGAVRWTGGYFIRSDMSAPAIASSYRTEHAATVRDLVEHYARSGKDLERRASLGGIRESLQVAQIVFESQPAIFGAMLRTNAGGIDRLRSDTRVASVSVKPDGQQRSKARSGALAAPARAHIARDNWVPSAIYVTVQPSAISGRYVSQDITWYSGRVLGFGQYDGMEADFFLSANAGTYLTTAEGCCGIPQVITWSTSFPANWRGDPPYLDTRVGDDTSTEYAYTIGTPGGQQLSTGVWYNTYIRTAVGSASTDYGRISPQLSTCGFPNPPCDTWSMASHDTCYSYWSIEIPAWQWFWDRFAGPWSCV
jgi:hypothetical protein